MKNRSKRLDFRKKLKSRKVNRAVPKTTIAIISIVCILAIGAIAGYIIAPKPAPDVLTATSDPKEVPVSQVTFDDGKDTTVDMNLGANGAITTTTAGRVTDYSCSTGAKLKSGDTFVSINGNPLVNLATSIPLWRNLKDKDSGKDVSALTAELARLGYGWGETDTVTDGVIESFNNLLISIGGNTDDKKINLDSILWLPANNQSVMSCGTQIGMTVSNTAKLAELSVPVKSAKLHQIPSGSLPGERVIKINGATYPVEANGDITNEDALTALGVAASSQQGGGGSGVVASWVLKTPMSVLAVPPSAIFTDESAKNSCIQQNDQIIKVKVVSSQLGQSYIVPAVQGANIESANMSPADNLVCQ
jgi:hypothetical protein